MFLVSLNSAKVSMSSLFCFLAIIFSGSLFEVYDVVAALDIGHGQVEVHVLKDRALLALDLNLLPCGEYDVLFVGFAEDALEFSAVGSEDLDLLADVVLPLAQHLEGLSQSGAADFEFVVLLVAREVFFDVPGELHTILDTYAVGVVDFYGDAVVGCHRKVGQEVVFAVEPLVNELFYFCLVNHRFELRVYSFTDFSEVRILDMMIAYLKREAKNLVAPRFISAVQKYGKILILPSISATFFNFSSHLVALWDIPLR